MQLSSIDYQPTSKHHRVQVVGSLFHDVGEMNKVFNIKYLNLLPQLSAVTGKKSKGPDSVQLALPFRILVLVLL